MNPAIFGTNQYGRGNAQARNEDGSTNDPEHPAERRSAVTLYTTGRRAGAHCQPSGDEPLDAVIGSAPGRNPSGDTRAASGGAGPVPAGGAALGNTFGRRAWCSPFGRRPKKRRCTQPTVLHRRSSGNFRTSRLVQRRHRIEQQPEQAAHEVNRRRHVKRQVPVIVGPAQDIADHQRAQSAADVPPEVHRAR